MLFSSLVMLPICLFALYVVQKKQLFIHLPLIIVFFEIGKGITAAINLDKGYNGLVFFVMFSIIMYLLIGLKRERLQNDVYLLFMLFLILFLYTIFRLNADINKIFNIASRYGNFLIIIAIFFIGYRFTINYHTFYYLLKFFLVGVQVFVLLTLFFTMLRIGPTAYRGGIIRGPTQFQLYYALLPIMLSPVVLVLNKCKKFANKPNQVLWVLIACCLIILFSLMRTTWIILTVALVLYVISTLNTPRKWGKTVGILLFALLGALGVVKSGALEIRASRFSNEYEMEDEGRFVEFEDVINCIRETPFIGAGNLFDAAGRYGYVKSKRPLHGTYSNLLYGAGYWGIILFMLFMFYVLVLFLLIKTKNSCQLKKNTKLVGVMIVVALLISFFSANTTYGFGYSYFTTSFLFLGSLYRFSSLIY